MESQDRINSPYWALRVAFGAVPFLAGLDKFFNFLTNWEKYMSPLAAHVLPVSTTPSQARHSVTGHCAFLPKKLICNEKYLSALNLKDI